MLRLSHVLAQKRGVHPARPRCHYWTPITLADFQFFRFTSPGSGIPVAPALVWAVGIPQQPWQVCACVFTWQMHGHGSPPNCASVSARHTTGPPLQTESLRDLGRSAARMRG